MFASSPQLTGKKLPVNASVRIRVKAPIADASVILRPQNKRQTGRISANVPVHQTLPAQKRAMAAF